MITAAITPKMEKYPTHMLAWPSSHVNVCAQHVAIQFTKPKHPMQNNIVASESTQAEGDLMPSTMDTSSLSTSA